MNVDAVLLDAGGVLLMPSPDAFRRHLAPFGVSPDDEACQRGHYASMREIDRIGREDWRVADRALAREVGLHGDAVDAACAAIEDIYLGDDWVPKSGVVDAMRSLRAAGLALAIVSNAEGTMARQLAGHRICQVGDGDGVAVEVVVDSTVVGVAKPDPEIFAIALRELGVAPERTLHVGDSVHFDVEGARAAGINAVHLDPYGFCPSDDHPHIRELAELTPTLVQ